MLSHPSNLTYQCLRRRCTCALRVAASLILCGTSISTNAQTIIWSDDFESYTAQEIPTNGSVGGWTDDNGARPTVIDGLSARNGQKSLRLDEGPGGDTDGSGVIDVNDNNGAGSFAFINFPETYVAGQFSLTFAQFIEGSVDSLHHAYISQSPFPTAKTGLDLYFDGQGLFVNFSDGTPAPVTIPVQLTDMNENVAVWDEDSDGAFTVNPILRTSRWIENQINIDLDANTFEWIYDDEVMVTYGTRTWDSATLDLEGPSLSSIELYLAATNGDANSDGVFGSIYYDDFVLTQLSGSLGCDADADGDCDLVDMDLFYQAFGTAGTLDLDESGTIDADDIDEWLVEASDVNNTYKADPADQYIFGDLDLNGDVDSFDLGVLLNNFLNDSGVGWSGGDINGDNNVASADLGLLLNNFGVTSVATAVPEPRIQLWVLLISGCMVGRRRTRAI